MKKINVNIINNFLDQEISRLYGELKREIRRKYQPRKSDDDDDALYRALNKSIHYLEMTKNAIERILGD